MCNLLVRNGKVVKTNIQLLSCPFCGGKAFLIMTEKIQEITGIMRELYSILCNGDGCHCNDSGRLDPNKNKVITWWNRRNK